MRTAAELRFGFWDVTAREDARLEATENQGFAHIADINRDEALNPPDVATLEPDFGWPLDGSKELIPTDKASVGWGWWSTGLSGANGAFDRPPMLTVTFSQPHSSMGITLAFLGTIPDSVNVVWYGDGGRVLADRDYQPDRLTYFCEQQVESYEKVVIKVWSMSAPTRYLRVVHIIFGALEILDGATLQSATLCEEVDISGLTLPIGTLEAAFWSPAGRFSLLSPSGAYRLFQRKQPIEVYMTVDEERRYMGAYYLAQAAGTVDNLTRLQCESLLGVLDRMEFRGGIYQAKGIGQLLKELLNDEGVAWELDPALEGETLTGWLPICTKREALQQIAIAVGAVVDASRRDGIALYPPPKVVTQQVGPGRKVVGHSVELDELVTRVDVTVHSYQLSEESKELSKAELTTGRHTIAFSKPVEVERVSGATLVGGGQNYAVIEVSQAGKVVVTGKEYIDNATVCTASNQALAGEQSSIKAVTNATLVDQARGPEVAQRLLKFYQQRYTSEGTILPGTEQVGAYAELASLGGRAITGWIQRLSTDLTGGCLAILSMRGQ